MRRQRKHIASSFRLKVKGGGTEDEKTLSRTWWVRIWDNTITVETHHSYDNIALNFDATRNVWILKQALFNFLAGAAIEEIHIDLVPEERHRGYRLRLTPHEPVEQTKGGTIHKLRISKKELYLDSNPHPTWILEYHPEQGWAWQKQRRGRHDRSPTERGENMDCHGFLIMMEADPTVLWEKVHKYTSQLNFVEELSVPDQCKWREWNLSLPLRAAVLLGAGASYPLGLPIGGQLLDSLFACLRAMSGPEIEKTYAIAKAVRKKERRRKQWRGNADVSAEELVAGLEMRVSPERRQLTPRVPSDEYLQDLKYSEEEYIHAIDTLVRLLLDVMRIVDKHKLWYLLPLVGAGKERSLTIASLNYDLAVEYACDIANVPYSTGIECWERSGEFPKPSTGVDLLKLHGSINWKYRQSVWQRRSVPEDKVLAKPTREIIEPAFPDIVPAVIFGSGNKLTATGPFLSLLATFAQRLEEHDLLLVCGYSFQDPHVNEILRRWFNRKQQRRIISIEKPGACQGDHWFTRQPDRYMQLNIGAEKALACLFACPHQ